MKCKIVKNDWKYEIIIVEKNFKKQFLLWKKRKTWKTSSLNISTFVPRISNYNSKLDSLDINSIAVTMDICNPMRLLIVVIVVISSWTWLNYLKDGMQNCKEWLKIRNSNHREKFQKTVPSLKETKNLENVIT